MTRMRKTSPEGRPVKIGIPQEIREQLKHLKSTRSLDVHVNATVSASEALGKLKSSIEQSQTPITIPAAKQICATLRRAALPTLRNRNCTIRYDDRTIEAMTAV